VKDIYVDGGKLPRNGRIMAIFVSCKFWATPSKIGLIQSVQTYYILLFPAMMSRRRLSGDLPETPCRGVFEGVSGKIG
jgi:hypothetical protein